MGRSAFLETADDIQWLKDTALRGVPLPAAYADFRFAIMQGNEDSPSAVNLYASATPLFTDNYYRVVFVNDPPIYCECAEYDGKTDIPLQVNVAVPESEHGLDYRGYHLTYDAARPVTGRWRAVRFGVSLCHFDLAALRRMIDQRIYDCQNSGPISDPFGKGASD